jgi:hypothetical protein
MKLWLNLINLIEIKISYEIDVKRKRKLCFGIFFKALVFYFMEKYV